MEICNPINKVVFVQLPGRLEPGKVRFARLMEISKSHTIIRKHIVDGDQDDLGETPLPSMGFQGFLSRPFSDQDELGGTPLFTMGFPGFLSSECVCRP